MLLAIIKTIKEIYLYVDPKKYHMLNVQPANKETGDTSGKK